MKVIRNDVRQMLYKPCFERNQQFISSFLGTTATEFHPKEQERHVSALVSTTTVLAKSQSTKKVKVDSIKSVPLQPLKTSRIDKSLPQKRLSPLKAEHKIPVETIYANDECYRLILKTPSSVERLPSVEQPKPSLLQEYNDRYRSMF